MSGADGRTVWLMKDSAWWRREYVVALGEEFGPAGPAVLDWLVCEAKVQNAGGWVKAGPRTIARGAFVDVETVCHVLSRAVTLRALDDYQEAGETFICRISGWESDQERGRAAGRQAARRERSRTENPDEKGLFESTAPATDEDVSRTVTPSHAPSREEKRREEETPRRPPKGGIPPIPIRPKGKRGRDQRSYQDAVSAYAAALLPDLEEPERSQLVRMALGHLADSDRTNDNVIAYAKKWSPATTAPEERAA